MSVDPSPHLNLIHRVIHQMGLKGDVAEEAFSESLVTLTIAARTYDPASEVPLANWLARNVRWGIANWMRKQKQSVPLDALITHPTAVESHKTELKEVIAAAEKILTEDERNVLFAHALGYSGIEIARAMRVTQKTITMIKFNAQAKMKEFMN